MLIGGRRRLLLDGLRRWLSYDHDLRIAGQFTDSPAGARLLDTTSYTGTGGVLVAEAGALTSTSLLWPRLRADGRQWAVLALVRQDGKTIRGADLTVPDTIDGPAVRAAVRRLAGLPDVAHSGALTDREVDVLELVASGAGNNEIADALFISAETVKSHLSRAYVKLGVSDRAGAVALALRQGLIA